MFTMRGGEAFMDSKRLFIGCVGAVVAGIAGTLFITALAYAQADSMQRGTSASGTSVASIPASAQSSQTLTSDNSPDGGSAPSLTNIAATHPPTNSSASTTVLKSPRNDIASTYARPPAAPAPLTAAPPNRARSKIKAAMSRLMPMTLFDGRRYSRAAATFPSFCHDWERKLHDREVNNLDHIAWQQRNGYQTATYTGYGKVESCQCKPTRQGVPIGKLTYVEMSYYLVGKTIEEAKRAKPKLLRITNTLEIFSWDKNRWFY
jgi:hypothetical protein